MVRNGRMDRRTVGRKKRHIEVGDPPKMEEVHLWEQAFRLLEQKKVF